MDSAIGRRPVILLVEDSHGNGIRSLPRYLLRDSGYQVLEAAHGLEALHMARQCREGLDVLVTEWNLPYMSGRELAAHLEACFPGLVVLFVLAATEANMVPAPVHVLRKPFTAQLLLTTLQMLLRARTAAGRQVGPRGLPRRAAAQ